jgi:hypothetical protein
VILFNPPIAPLVPGSCGRSIPLTSPTTRRGCGDSTGDRETGDEWITTVSRRGRDGGGGRWLLFRRFGWHRLRAGRRMFFWGSPGPGLVPGADQFGMGRGQPTLHGRGERAPAIPGRGCASRETPSARTVLRKRRILSRNRRSRLHIPTAVSASALDDSPRFRPGRSARVPSGDHPAYLASRMRALARA